MEPFTRGNMDRLAVQSLDQGMFAFPRPKPIHVFGYIITLSSVLTAYILYSQSLGIPDVPRVEEATVLPYLHEDVSAYDFAPVQKGYNGDEYASEAAFILVPLELEGGTIATDDCTWVEDEDGNGDWHYSFYMASAQELVMVDAEGTRIFTGFSLEGSLSPEGEVYHPVCNDYWSRTIAGNGIGSEDNFNFNAFLMVEQDPVRYQLLSVVEIWDLNNPSEEPQEVTQREDRGRWALLSFGFAGLIFMYSTSPPLMHELRAIRKKN